MKQIKWSVFFVVVKILFLFSSFAQYNQYTQRGLLEKKIFYIGGGKIATADYWSLPLGQFDCTLNKFFPGEGNLNIEVSMNFALLSSGYVEGTGYGTRGKAEAQAQFGIKDGDSTKNLELSEIDYVYKSNEGCMVVLTNGKKFPLFINCEVNNLSVSTMKLMIWTYDKTYNELKHSNDINTISAFSFTKEGAARALKALQ